MTGGKPEAIGGWRTIPISLTIPGLKSAPMSWALIPQSATLYVYASAANPSFPAESKSIVSSVLCSIS